MHNTLRFELDLTEVEQVDTGREVVFGGFYTLDGVKHRATGDDRTTGNYLDEIMDHIQSRCEQQFGEQLEHDDLFDVLMQLESGTILVDYTEAGLTVWLDENE